MTFCLQRESKTWEELCGKTAGRLKNPLKIILEVLLGNLFLRWNSYSLSFGMTLGSVHVCAHGLMNGFGRIGFPFSRKLHMRGLLYSGSPSLIFFPQEKNYNLGEKQKWSNVFCFFSDHCPILCPSVSLKQGSDMEHVLILHVKIAHLKIRIICQIQYRYFLNSCA